MNNSLRRARILGAALAIAMFALGAVTGWLAGRRPPDGMRVMITATDAVPKELEQLSLSPLQRDSVQLAIRRGRDRVLRVVDEFDPMMRAALDSTNFEIRALLDSTQRIRFDSLQRSRRTQTERRFIGPNAGKR